MTTATHGIARLHAEGRNAELSVETSMVPGFRFAPSGLRSSGRQKIVTDARAGDVMRSEIHKACPVTESAQCRVGPIQIGVHDLASETWNSL